MLSAIIISIILRYIYKFLKFGSAIWFYWELLDKSNIPYLIKKIVKLKYKNLTFFMPDSSKIDIILKKIIFVNKIDKT